MAGKVEAVVGVAVAGAVVGVVEVAGVVGVVGVVAPSQEPSQEPIPRQRACLMRCSSISRRIALERLLTSDGRSDPLASIDRGGEIAGCGAGPLVSSG